MKNLFALLFVLNVLFCVSKAQQKSTLIGFSVQAIPKISSAKNFSSIKVGLPSFSYASSIEKRFTLRNQLEFSLQYSLNYFAYNQFNKNNLFQTNSKKLSHSLSFNTSLPIHKQTSLLSGIGLQSDLPKIRNFKNKAQSELISSESINNTSHYNFNNFNPYFLIGIENGIQLFNTNLIYSMQYNFGFSTLKNKEIRTNDNGINSNGFRIGLKYKY